MMEDKGDAITLKELILLLQEYIQYFWRNKWVILLFVVAGVFYSGYVRFVAPPSYQAELTFMLNEGEKGSMGGVGSILGQLGIEGRGGGGVSLAKIKELSRSRRIIQNVMFDTVVIDNETDIIANHIIRMYDYWKGWKGNTEGLEDFMFTHANTDSFSRTENDVMKTVYFHIIGNPSDGAPGLVYIDYKDDTGIVTVTSKTREEELSIMLSSLLYEELSNFYVEKTTEGQKITLDKLNETADSVLLELRSVEYQVAQFRDRAYSVVMRKNKVKEYDLLRKQQTLNMMYSEVVRNKETSTFLLNTKKPNFQIIDSPIVPIYPSSKKVLKGGVIGGILGGVLCLTILLLVRVYRETMKS